MVIKFYARNLLIFSLLISLITYSNQSFAQGFYDYNWYFGNSVEAIIFNKFNNDPLVVNDQAVPFGIGGSAVATDANTGQLLFYADGDNVYDASHNIMFNGGGILGNASGNQPVAISPIPGEPGRYYIFSNTADFNNGGTSGIRYTIVDMNLAGNAVIPGQPNLGEVVGGSKNQLIPINQSAEGMIVLEAGTAGQYWLIVYNQVTFDISAYDVQAGGSVITTPAQTFNVPSQPLAANLSYSPAAGKIAISPQDVNKNIVILNFDNNTGTFTFDQNINNSAVNDITGEAIYDTEWSPDGTKLYISRHGNLPAPGASGDMYQFDFNSPGNSFVSLINGPVYRSYGLKMGPDQRIYHLYQIGQFDPIRLGRINAPNQIVDSINYETNVLNATGFASQQFPEFAPPEELMLNTISFEHIDSCLNSTTKFFPEFEDDPQPDNFIWDFGGGGAGQENYIAPIVTYQAPGSYNVSLTITAGGDAEVFSDVVNILQNDLMINLGNDTTICPGETLMLDPQPMGQQGNLTYGWSTQETTPTITVDSAGTYWVVVTDQATGCDTYDAIVVTVYGNEEQTGNFWYFGNNAGIDFNENPPVALSDGAQNAPEGAATVSDANGDLLFYTDGQTVYNRNHAVMPGGNDINMGGSNGATQSSLIVQFPGDETMYYIFTTDAVFGDGTYNMRYSVVDLKEDAPFGKVTVKGKPLFVRSTEKLTSTAPGGDVTWVLGHEFGNNTFRAYPIDTLGIRQAVLSAVGAVHNNSIENNGRGYMKFAQGNDKLAVTIPGNPNIVEVFDFDTNTGEVSNPYEIDLMENSGFVYGVEWSPGGNKLYVSVNFGNGNSVLKEYAFDSLRTEAALLNEENVNLSLGAIQFAPDNQIYVAIDGSNTLGSISVNEDSAQVSVFNPAGFNLAGGTTSTLGLPNAPPVPPPPTMDPNLSFTQACAGQETSFTGTGTSNIDEFFWTFGDGNQSNEQNPMHTYQNPGTFNVALRITNRCGFDSTLNAMVEVFGPPQSLGSRAESICDDDLQLTATNDTSPDLTFAWTSNNGQVFSDRVITIMDPGEYIVTITNATGCSETDTINVVDGRPATNLGPDQTVCQNQTVNDLDAQNPNATITWFVNGVDQNNPSRFQAVDTSVDGVFEYVVFVEDALTSCIRRDTVNITVSPEPDIAVAENPSTCGNNDGSIDLTLNDTGDFSYTLTGPNGSSGPIVNGPNSIPGLGAGTYSLVVTNNLTGCTVTQNNITIVDDPSTFQIVAVTPSTAIETFCDDMGSVGVELSADVFPVTWRVFDDMGTDITASLGGAGGPSPNEGGNAFTISGLGDGTFTFEVTAGGPGGCVQTRQETFTTTPIDFTIAGPPDACAGDGTQWQVQDGTGAPFVDPDFEVEWTTTTGSFASGGQSQTGATVGINAIGTHRYFVTVRSLTGGFCDTTDSIDVTIQEPPVVTFSTSGDVCDGQVQLSANVQNALPGEVFTYDWASTAFPDVQTINVGPSANEITHLIRVGSNLRTCVTTADTTFKVNEPIDIVLTPEPACDDGQPITITAEVVQPNVTYAWSFNGAALGFSTPEIEVMDEGLYTVTVSNAECSSEESVNIVRAPFTPGDLPAQAIICPADPDPEVNSVLLDPGSGFTSYEWIFNGNTTTTPTFLATQAGTIEVNLTNGFDCTDSRTVEIIEDCVPRLSAPNAFSPNNNGQNETFSVFTTFVTKFEIFIYNRWGELVYHSTDKDFQWDGNVNGNPAPIGTYAYVIRFESDFDRSGRTLEQRGGVTLVR